MGPGRPAVTGGSRGSSPRTRSVPIARISGLNIIENAGRGVPSATASTSRSTPVNCSAISPAELKRLPGSALVARRSSRPNESCCASSGTPSGNVNLYELW